MSWNLNRIIAGAQFFIVPLLFFSCTGGASPDIVQFADSTVTMVSYDHVMVYAGNGQKSYKMSAPEIRRYEYASEPYTIYPRGLKIFSYSDSIPDKVIADLTADYAVLWDNTNMWEARGNIVGNNYLENKHFETDILFWDQENGLIYNDHYTKVLDGENWWTGYGFETNDGFDTWRFNRSRGLMAIHRDVTNKDDSLEYVAQPQDSLPDDNGQLTRMEQKQLEENEAKKEKSKQAQMWEEIF